MQDIRQRKDLELLVSEFYKKVLVDDKIAPVFIGKIKIDWESHLPIICDFWENLLWGGDKYQANLLQKHLDFNKHIPFTHLHLERWLLHWNATLTENFEGDNATQISERAGHIGRLILFKISQK
ncbi:MAG: group III truncated hemoglobin [Flavobacteriales bacterium]|jgi:hemoglobin|nr:group III truncated hemoglobin [Flavobacteriales bacterium]